MTVLRTTEIWQWQGGYAKWGPRNTKHLSYGKCFSLVA
jgi:hypothetical protein